MGACQSTLLSKGKSLKLYEKPDAKSLKQDRALARQYEETLAFLQKVPLFSRLPPADQPMVGLALVSKVYEAGESVIREGDQGDEFFIIYSGEAVVLKGTQELCKLKPGDYFGEGSLLEDTPRNASIKVAENAKHSLKTLSITREKFEELGVRERLRFPRRRAVAADSDDREAEKVGEEGDKIVKSTEKTEAEVALIKMSLMQNKYLSAILRPEQVESMIEKAWKTTVKRGEKVIEEASLVADRFYIISSGNFTVKKMVCKTATKNADTVTTASLEDDLLCELSAAEEGASHASSFGELALLYNAPRAATVEATTDGELFVVDRHDFKQILRQQTRKKLEFYLRLISSIELLSVLLHEEKSALVECFVELHYRRGQTIMTEGESGKTFYILYQGSVSVHKNGEKVTDLVADPSAKKCPYFGEQALLNDLPRNATIQVESGSAALLCLDRSTFESILGPLRDIMSQNDDNKGRKSMVQGKRGGMGGPGAGGRPLLANPLDGFKKPRFEDLNQLGLLGSGGFGKVSLVKCGKSKQSYALKAVSKGYIVKMNLQDQICNERRILSMTNSHFITLFYGTYSSNNFVFFLMEPCLGGEIFAIYCQNASGKKKNNPNTGNPAPGGSKGPGLGVNWGDKDGWAGVPHHGSYPHAMYYGASVVRGFQHLHERKIVFRDLKPENMLLSREGRCKLTDMGLAKLVWLGRTYTTCGTPDYFAPEVIQSCGHNSAVDWWTFGVLLYELTAGAPPFSAIEDPLCKYRKIVSGIADVKFPTRLFREPCTNLIRELMQRDPSQRLPMRPGGVTENLVTHEFFAGFDWEGLDSKKLRVPFKPKVRNSEDLQNFGGTSEEDCPPSIPYVDPGTNWDRDFY